MKFYNEICQKLKDGIPFRFSRWGDGEWGCMKGWIGTNRDGNEYLPELRNELSKILSYHPEYYLGLQYGVLYNTELRNFVFGVLFDYHLDWVNGDVLHQASEYGRLCDLIEALSGRNVTVIGAKYFEKLPYKYIVTPGVNSYQYNKDIFREIEAIDVTGYNANPVYLVASAMNSNVIIDKLPDNVTAIDIGSVFDPYLGKPRARYQHNMKAEWLW